MKLKLEDWNIKSKEDFIFYLLKEAHARFYEAKAIGRITSKEYWYVWDDLCTMSQHYLGVNVSKSNPLDKEKK